MAFCRVSLGFKGGDWGSASSEPATDDLSGEGDNKGSVGRSEMCMHIADIRQRLDSH